VRDGRVVIGVDVRSDRDVNLYTRDEVTSFYLINEQNGVVQLLRARPRQQYRQFTCTREQLGYVPMSPGRARVHPLVIWNAFLVLRDGAIVFPIPVAIKFNSRR